LHWGNLLVTTNKDRKDLLESVKSLDESLWNLLISDLGEGKVIGGVSTIGRKYGPPEYRAPEIEHSNANYTASSDMYSLGQLAKDIVKMYWTAAERKGVNAHFVSKTVADLIDRLVESTDPKDRPTAEEVAEAMQGLWRKAMHEYDFLPENLDLVQYAEADLEPEIPF
jgi:serine/threonine protein kinase